MIDVSDLCGLTWRHETADCYALACAFYKKHFNLVLDDHARPPFWFQRNPELDLLRTNFHSVGFEIFTGSRREMRLGDGILMAFGSSAITHCGVYLGDGWMLHHPFRGKSERVLYAGIWLDRTMIVGRHPGVVLPTSTGKVNLLDLIPAHKKAQLEDVYNQSTGTSGLHTTDG